MGNGQRRTADADAAHPSMEAAANLQGQDGMRCKRSRSQVDESAEGGKKEAHAVAVSLTVVSIFFFFLFILIFLRHWTREQ